MIQVRGHAVPRKSLRKSVVNSPAIIYERHNGIYIIEYKPPNVIDILGMHFFVRKERKIEWFSD